VKIVVDEISMGIGRGNISQSSIVDEYSWIAINVPEGPTPPPIEFAFPWWLVGIGTAVAVIIHKRNIMKKYS
jgi:hypothetical protein